MPPSDKYLVSVIIPTFNRADCLNEALNTVIGQTHKNIEIIIINDNSTDNTLEILNKIKFPNIQIFNNNKSIGASACRNIGINNSKGNFIAFIDDDDLWYPNKIELQINYLLENPDTDCVFCDYKYVLDKIYFIPDRIKYDITLSKTILSRSIGGFSLPLIKKDCIDRVGLLDVKLPSCQDWDYWIRLYNNTNINYIPECLVIRNLGKNQISSDLKKKIEGREHLLNKHLDLISKYPAIENMHLCRLGSLNILAGNTKISKDYFLKSFKTYPYSLNTFLHLILSYISTDLHKYLISKYGIHKYGNIKLYH